jgi:hypothetical protein
VGVDVVSLVSPLCSLGGMDSMVQWRWWSLFSGRKSCPTWSADNDDTRGRHLPSWGVVVEYRYPSVHHSGVKAQTRLVGSDDGGVFGRRDLLAGVISRSVGRHSLRC